MGDEVRQIPGYYYDQEKKKYFKISKGTGNTAYSSRDVKRRKVKDENAQEAAATFAKEKDRIRRSKILVSASAGGFLHRSYGHSRLDLVPEIFASKLVQQPEAPWIEEVRMGRSHFGGIINPIFDIQHRGDIGPSTSDCHLGFRNMMVSVRFNAEDVPDDCSQYVKNISQVNTVLFHGMFTVAAPSSSVSVNVSKGFVLSTWLASRFNSGIAMSYIEPGPDGQSNFASAGPTIQMGPGLRRGSEVSIYSSTASPQSSSSLFVVGTSEGIIQVANREPNWLTPKQPAPDTDNPYNIPKDVFALEFLRNDPSVLLSGGRRGILNITDLRVPVFDANADIIRHPSSIIHIKQINDHRIIVAGLRSSLCQYDLRFRKHQNYQTATAPYLQYHDYFNETLWPLGFDVDIDAGIVAAAQQSKAGVATGGSLGGPIHLYSLRTGKLLRKIPTGKTSSTDCNDSGWVQSLRFSQDNDGSSRSSLYFGSSEFAGLNRYGWPDLEDDA